MGIISCVASQLAQSAIPMLSSCCYLAALRPQPLRCSGDGICVGRRKIVWTKMPTFIHKTIVVSKDCNRR